ncbi:MAG: hypothetical protein ACKVWR_12455 [Acidimicrobiales bacterium]
MQFENEICEVLAEREEFGRWWGGGNNYSNVQIYQANLAGLAVGIHGAGQSNSAAVIVVQH